MKTKHGRSSLTIKAGTNPFLLTPALGLLAFALTLGPTVLSAASPADTLEEGIYTEETKGDLDAAMTLYRQVVAESKTGETSAAQAEYRLGVCYYRQKNYAEASAAFEKLIKDYPNEKELVKAARKYLDGTQQFLPAPWADGEQMRLSLKLASGYEAGTAIYTVDSGETNGQKIWRFGSHLYVGLEQLSSVEVEADSLKPIHSRWKHTLLGDADTRYFPGYAEVKFAGKDSVKKVELDGTVYDNEEAVQGLRRLPLATNYSITLPIFSSLGGGVTIPIKCSVVGFETVTNPVGTFEAYKVALEPVKQTFWVSMDAHHYVVKFEGGGVVAELTDVSTRNPNAPAQYHGDSFSLSAPPDWMFYNSPNQKIKTKTVLAVIDPNGLASSHVTVLPTETKKSLHDLADSMIDEQKNVLGLTVRTNSWQDRTIAGQPALSFICDYTEGTVDKVAYAVCGYCSTNRVLFSALLPSKDFEAFRPKFDSLVDSYKPN
jgi:hypothetical protein